MNDIFGYLITGICSIIVAMLGQAGMLKRKDQEHELKSSVKFQQIEDRLSNLETLYRDSFKNNQEILNELNEIKIKISEIRKDIGYLNENR